ncbi:MAG: DNA replication/repair protein RecF [Clostridia bacterium]|nr:DNA replication/repair protein RecF [Clostridia bacterium]
MYLDCAVFENYRNIEHFPFSFDKEINILYGKNAQGKTNVIEGIYLFGSGKSFRHARDKDLIKADQNHAQVSIAYVDSQRENKMSYRIFRDMSRETIKNGIKIGRMSSFIGHFKAVLFCPEHLAIVKNEPAERRGFLDAAISQFNRPYLAALMEYKKLLEQRNALLKNYEKNKESFALTAEILSEKLAQNAAYITEVRAKYLKRLFSLVNDYLSDMTGGREGADFLYLSHAAGRETEALFDREENLRKYRRIFSKDLQKEIVIGTTVGGSHKDDFEIKLGGMNAKIFASQGQQRSIALAMKLAEGEISREESGEYPVFLLDDVLSELDRERKNYVLSELHGRQVIITTCDEADFAGISHAAKIYVENGNYTYI